MSARFITFEGGEGAGKTTQISRTAEWLRNQGIDVITTREPGGTDGAEKIRDLLVRDTGYIFTPMAELALIVGARVDHVQKIIKPALEKDTWVLCDRFADSSRVYQGIAQKLGVGIVQKLHDVLLEGFEPDATFFIDVPVEIGLNRTQSRGDNEDRYENMDIKFHQSIRDGFLSLAHKNPRFSIIDGTSNIDTVFADIIDITKAFVNE